MIMEWPNAVRVRGRVPFLEAVRGLLPPEPVCVELGVFLGRFASGIWKRLEPSRLFLVDPWRSDGERLYGDGGLTCYSGRTMRRVRARFPEQVVDGRVVLVRKLSFEAVGDFPDAFFDFVYVDASHRYVDVRRDLEEWAPKLRRGGVLAGHDYEDVPGYGVIQAVDEFCVARGLEVRVLCAAGRWWHGDWAVVLS